MSKRFQKHMIEKAKNISLYVFTECSTYSLFSLHHVIKFRLVKKVSWLDIAAKAKLDEVNEKRKNVFINSF